jgi:predicted Zn finger-like uncharacterized protein
MTSASNQMITRCPKCGTAFRVTPSQLQSAKGAVRCGSCLNVFKAQEYLVASLTAPATAKTLGAQAGATAKPTATTTFTGAKPGTIKTAPPSASNQTLASKSALTATHVSKPAAKPDQPAILSTIKPLAVDTAKSLSAATASTTTISTVATKSAAPRSAKPVIRTINKSSLGQADDILISDDMEDNKAESKNYEFDGFMDIDVTSKSDISLFERKIRDKDTEADASNTADESWAEMLIEDEDEDIPQLGVLKPKNDEQLADDELSASHAVNPLKQHTETPATPTMPTTAPGLVFSLIGEKEEQPAQHSSDDLIMSEELARIPSNQGFNHTSSNKLDPNDRLDPNLFETPDENVDGDNETPKRQVKTQPKIRAYDGSRTALLMNIIPAPIEFSAKRMRRWYQRKLWPGLSILALVALAIQVGWFKFDYFSRVEPYRTGYLFLCPYLGCQVPTLVDTSRIIASNLVVREHPETEGALAVDVMLINSAPFEQPFPDLILVFTDIDENQVASRRFIPKDYLGGEMVGKELMPQNQKIHITLDLVDPGDKAVNYHISIPRQ